VLVARTLGAEGYGALVAAIAVAGLFSFAAMGATAVLLREGTRRPDRLSELIGDLLRTWVFILPIVYILAFGACVLVLHHTLSVCALLAITLAEVVCAPAVDGIGRLHQSQGRIPQMGAVAAGLALARFATFSLLMPIQKWTPEGWAFGYFASSVGYLIVLIALDRKTLISVTRSSVPLRVLIRRSFAFSFYNVAYKAHGELNKPALAHWTGPQSAGLFSAAHRCTDIVVFPTLALIEALIPRIYKARQPLKAAARLGLAPLGLALLGGAFLANAASWIPELLGSSYRNSISLTQVLALLPSLFVLRSIFDSVIAASNLQHLFLIVHGFALIVLLALLWKLIPALGVQGAVIVAYVIELCLITAQIAILYRSRVLRP
jgi:O-antigen/teichoic acid export membrane protein